MSALAPFATKNGALPNAEKGQQITFDHLVSANQERPAGWSLTCFNRLLIPTEMAITATLRFTGCPCADPALVSRL